MTASCSPCRAFAPLRGSQSSEAPNAQAAGAEDMAEEVLFEATLYPHRSLSSRGFVILMTAIALVGFLAGLVFFLIGAWPVIGFMGLEFLLVYIAFRINYRRARQYEIVKLTRDCLTLVRVNHYGDLRRWSFQPYWLKLSVGSDPEANDPLVLSSHGRQVQVGSFLNGQEKIELGQALQGALQKLR
ncbi:DUF2244 domain-containing protein [Rhodovibrionaceae bacterium A322]